MNFWCQSKTRYYNVWTMDFNHFNKLKYIVTELFVIYF